LFRSATDAPLNPARTSPDRPSGLQEIAKAFGKGDQGTVSYALKMIRNARADPRNVLFTQDLDNLARRLNEPPPGTTLIPVQEAMAAGRRLGSRTHNVIILRRRLGAVLNRNAIEV
jgi:hypothetical protein